jgi:hypothetical protein
MLAPDHICCPAFACPVSHICARGVQPNKYQELFESTPYDHTNKCCHAFIAGNELAEKPKE